MANFEMTNEEFEELEKNIEEVKKCSKGGSNREYCKKVLEMYRTRCKRYEDLVFSTGYSEAEVTAAILWHCLHIMLNITEEEN